MRKLWLVVVLGAFLLAPVSLLAQPVAKIAVSTAGAIDLNDYVDEKGVFCPRK